MTGYDRLMVSPGLVNCNPNSNNCNSSSNDQLNSVRQHLANTIRPHYYYYHHNPNSALIENNFLSNNSVSLPSLINNNHTTNIGNLRNFPPQRNQSFQPHLPARKLSKLSNLCWVSSVSQPDLTLTTTTLSPVTSLPTSRASSPGAPISRGASPFGSGTISHHQHGGISHHHQHGGSQVGLTSLTNTTSSSSYYLNQMDQQQRLQQQQQQLPVYTSRFGQQQLMTASSPPGQQLFQPDPGPGRPSYHQFYGSDQQLRSHLSPEPLSPSHPFGSGQLWGGGGSGLVYPPLQEVSTYEQLWTSNMSPPPTPLPPDVLVQDINGNQELLQHKQWQDNMALLSDSDRVMAARHVTDLNHPPYQQQQLQQQQQLRIRPGRSAAAPPPMLLPMSAAGELGKPCAIIMPQQQQQQQQNPGCVTGLSSSAPSPPSPMWGYPYDRDEGEMKFYKQQQEQQHQQQQRAISVPRQLTATSPTGRFVQLNSPLIVAPRMQRSVGTSCSDLAAWEQQQHGGGYSISEPCVSIPFVVEMCQICNVFKKGSGEGECAPPYYRYSPCLYGGRVLASPREEQGSGQQRSNELVIKRWVRNSRTRGVVLRCFYSCVPVHFIYIMSPLFQNFYF